MKTLLRTLVASAALAAFAAAHADVSLYYADSSGNKLTSITGPAAGSSMTLSVFYTSTTMISDSEIFASYDTATSQGPSATPTAKLVSLTSPTAASGVALNGVTTAGGYGSSASDTSSRPYGLDILSVSASSGMLPASSAGALLFTVTLNDLALTPGSTASIGFYTATAPIYTTNFYDANANKVGVTGTSLSITAPRVNPPNTPEPSAFAAVGFGVLALLRRRRRA